MTDYNYTIDGKLNSIENFGYTNPYSGQKCPNKLILWPYSDKARNSVTNNTIRLQWAAVKEDKPTTESDKKCADCKREDCFKKHEWEKVITELDEGTCNSMCDRERRWKEHWKVTNTGLVNLRSDWGFIWNEKKKYEHPSGSGCANYECLIPENNEFVNPFRELDAEKYEQGKSSRSEVVKCSPGEGLCPYTPIDCEYEYGVCKKEGDNCYKTLNIIKEPQHNGKACPSENKILCQPGDGECPYNPVDCKEDYGSCYILNDSDVPPELKGKCGKKNVIYENPNHGGKSCVNSKYILCNDGEGSCPSDCDGDWSACDSNCDSTFIKTIQEKNGGKCPPDNKPKPVCNPGMGNCEANIDCEGEWSDCNFINGKCVKTYTHIIPKSGSGYDCRYRDGYIEDCNSCKELEVPAPVPAPAPAPAPTPTPGPVEDKDEQKPKRNKNPKNIPTPVPTQVPSPAPSPVEYSESDKSTGIQDYVMIGIIVLMFLYIVMIENK